ncbi:MAG: SDR family oxidoreductase [Lautropia sp.]
MSGATTRPQIHDEPKLPFPAQHQRGTGAEALLEPAPRFAAPRYLASGKLRDKVALITGGDSGIGRAVAVLYAREGADVAIAYLPSEQADADETGRQVAAAGRRCELLPGDLADPGYCEALVATTVERLGRLDIVVSNAAQQNRVASLAELTDAELERTFAVNVYAYFRLCRAALPHLRPGSAIIATSSETGIQGSKELPHYSATKGAINAFTKALAQRVLADGIRVNAVAPGPVWTPLNPADDGMTPERVAEFGKNTPIGRPAQPEEIAPAYVYLASDADASFTTGIVLPIMGGKTIGG